MTITRANILLCLSVAFAACGDDSAPEPGAEGTGGSTSSAASTSGATEAADSSSGDGAEESSGTAGSTGAGLDCDGRPTERPSVRSELEGVWDTDGGRMIMFGGDQGMPVMCSSQTDFVAETWAFHPDCDNFELLDAGGGPSPRGRHAVALDPVGGRMLVHGGRWRAGTSGTYTVHDDTWAFDMATQTWEALASGPSPRSNHTAVVANNQLLIYGGNASDDGLVFSPLGDLWSLDLESGAWTELSTKAAPAARLFHAATVSDDGSTMFVYAGGGANAFTGPFFPELNALDLQTGEWSVLHDGSGTAPVRSIWGDLLFDAPNGRLILWGAHEDNLLGNNNKLWAFDLGANAWSLLAEGDVLNNMAAGFCDFPVDFVVHDADAPERRNAGAAVITGDDELLVFGGKTDCGVVDDVWSWPLSGGPWDNRVRATLGEICVRAFAEGCESMCI